MRIILKDKPDHGRLLLLTFSRASAFPESIKPGTLSLYFETPDIVASHKEISEEGVEVNDIRDDLFGPGSGT